MGNDILEGILRLVHTNLLILLIKYITQVTEKCIHNAGVGGSSPPVATIPLLRNSQLTKADWLAGKICLKLVTETF